MIQRDEAKAREKLLADCKRPAFARLARYTKEVESGSGETVTRASVKFVEAALARWGNVRTQNVITSDTDKARTVRVMVTDLEGGAEYSKEILLEKIAERVKIAPKETVLGIRESAAGRVFLVPATEDDLAAKEAVLASIVVRQLGLRILPADLVAECMDVVAETLGEQPGVMATVLKGIADGLGIPASEMVKSPSFIDPQVHPQESRSSALAGLLKQRKAQTPTKAPAAPQASSKAPQIWPTAQCANCDRPIWKHGKAWEHTDGNHKCGEGRAIAKPKAVQA